MLSPPLCQEEISADDVLDRKIGLIALRSLFCNVNTVNKEKKTATPDNGMKYLSTPMYRQK